MYGCERWTIKKAECWSTDAFELRCWRRLLRVPWTARRSKSESWRNQCWIFIGKTDAEAPILWPPDVKSWLLEKTLIPWKIEGRRRRGWQRMRQLDSIIDSVGISLRKFWEIVKNIEAWHAAVHGIAKSRTQLSDWTTCYSRYAESEDPYPSSYFLCDIILLDLVRFFIKDPKIKVIQTLRIYQ